MYTVHTTIVTCAKFGGSCVTSRPAATRTLSSKSEPALTEQLSPKIFNGHVEGPNLPFLPRHPCGHCRQPTVWLCCCIGWYLTPFCTSTHVLCVQILKANGWMTCHCWLTIAHRYRSAFGAASLLIMSLHGTRVLGQQGRPISVRREATCNLACEELRRSVASGR